MEVKKPDFWKNDKLYYDLKSYWRNLFGATVYKLPVDAGFTCPNRDGSKGSDGCSYCDGRGSQLRQNGILPPITQQIEAGKNFYRLRTNAESFIAYFQTFTNTYAPVSVLKSLYDEALSCEKVIGLSIGTRPDCVDEKKISLIADYAAQNHIWVEYGIQSMKEETLKATGRGHGVAEFVDAVEKTARRNILICAHIIIGLPNESREDMLHTARSLAALPIDGIKIHSLLALQGTPLGEAYLQGGLPLLTLAEYATIVSDVLEVLPSHMVIQRLTADGYKDIFLAPAWARNKLTVINAIERELSQRNSFQGKKAKG
ncbi:MAG: TIGR01212 family radical SAM protein [Deltaproteobacteria bacterium]|nr:TIGR01212 family radical SAM protein [Deltaproteobacteria bacterium]